MSDASPDRRQAGELRYLNRSCGMSFKDEVVARTLTRLRAAGMAAHEQLVYCVRGEGNTVAPIQLAWYVTDHAVYQVSFGKVRTQTSKKVRRWKLADCSFGVGDSVVGLRADGYGIFGKNALIRATSEITAREIVRDLQEIQDLSETEASNPPPPAATISPATDAAPPNEQSGYHPAWRPDPTGRNAERYWGGHAWSRMVRNGDVQTVDQGALPSASDGWSEPGLVQAAPSAPGWYSDPWARYQLRYWDGQAWTFSVQRDGVGYNDPPVALTERANSPAWTASRGRRNLTCIKCGHQEMVSGSGSYVCTKCGAENDIY